MDKPFFIDKNVITYNQLISEINGIATINNPSEIEILVIDIIKKLISKSISDYNDLISNIMQNNASIQLTTSGTTGEPKIINHTFVSMTNNIKISDNRFDDIWGFTYNPLKMAGYQVLFQSILNKNTLINLFKYDYTEITNRILKYKITHISATPTFYKLLTSESTTYPNVTHISLGGEGSDLDTQSKIKSKFPNAKIKNIYASTEVSSLLATNGELFKIPLKYKNLIRLDTGHLLVHTSLIGKSDNISLNDEWYDTGDLIDVINVDSFKIVGRLDSLINVGGYQINPTYIESKISGLDYVKICKVYSKSNSLLGNIVVCDLVLTKDIKIFDIKTDMKLILNDYEVPTKINIVDEITINENGKISRK
jgi:acyl-coenzyme A synthetase/AMP-(fatty) acid ligase